MRVKYKQSKRSNNNRNVFVWFVAFLLLAVALCSGYVVVNHAFTYKKASDEYKNLAIAAVTKPEAEDSSSSKDFTSFLTIDYSMLMELNPDYSAWIDIPGTKLSYPVVFASDYYEYIHTTFDGQENPAGTIFMDYNCERDFSSRNTILYGHNMYDGSMFNTLRSYTKSEYFEQHNQINVYIGSRVNVFTVFAFFETEAIGDVYTVDFDSDGVFQSYLAGIEARSWYTGEVVPGANDRIITLSTCSRDEGDYRWVLFAVLTDTIELPRTGNN